MKKNDTNIRFGCRTDIGIVREHNEDSLYAKPPLFAVADGMGGHAAGEVASEIAIGSLERHAPRTADSAALAKAVEIANHDVIKGAIEGKGKQGMGTTMTAAVIEGEKVVIAQVGDSRAYLLHQGNLQQITRDHSLMADLIESGQITPAEARVHPNRSLITRALGSDREMFADQYEIGVHSGDKLLLCSDGLTGMVTDDVIEKFLTKYEDPQECADKLVDEAIKNGGLDNITVIVVDIVGMVTKKKRKIKRRSRALFIFIIILALAIIAGAITLGTYIVQSSAYLANDNGYVAVYKGTPGSFAGIDFSHKEYTTDIKVDDLNENIAERLNSGIIKVDDLDAADRVINQYRSDVQEKKSKSGTNNNTNNNNNANNNNNNTKNNANNNSNNNANTQNKTTNN